MKKTYLTPIELYQARAFHVFILLTPLAGLCAALTFTAIKFSGFYKEVSWTQIGIFFIINIIYLIVGMYLPKNSSDEGGALKERFIKYGKLYIVTILFVQWCLISHVIPSTDFWAYIVYFLINAMFFLDHKFLLLCEGELIVLICISCAIRPDALLPARDAYFITNILLRAVFIFLSFLYIWIVYFLIEKVLVRELENVAERDSLTHLKNRRSLYKDVDSLIEKGTFSVLMCDIDNFKSVNDTYGHDFGDVVLKEVSSVLQSLAPNPDYVFRYGGEEILILIPTGKDAAMVTAEKMRKAVENNIVTLGNDSASVTITIGVSEYSSKFIIDEIINIADERMYAGKQSGKNTVIGFGN